MKTYKNLWNEIISDENIALAIKESCKHKKKNKRKQQQLEKLKNNPKRTEKVRKWIETYETRKCKPKEIYDGISRKKRYIYVPTVRETVVQHALVQVLNKYLAKGMYEHTYAAINGRGAHEAKKQICKWIKRYPKKVKYFLKMDIKQYFPSVSQDILFEMVSRQVKDEKVVSLFMKITGACDRGTPLGYYISQWTANYYLMHLDHFIKDNFDCFYIRWMDDMVVFCSNKKKLHKIKDSIADYLSCNLALKLKENWKIARFCHHENKNEKKCKGEFLDYMGFRFYRNRVTLRESIFYRATRKAKKIGNKDKPTMHDLRQFMSYFGWIKHTDTYSAYLKYIKPHVNIQNIKRRTSRHDKNKIRKEKSNDGISNARRNTARKTA